MNNTENTENVEANTEPESEPESCVDNLEPEPRQMSALVYDNKHLLSDGAVNTYQTIFLQHENEHARKMEELKAPLFKVEYIKTITIAKNRPRPRDSDCDTDEDDVPIVAETNPGIKPDFLVAWLRGKTGFCSHMKNRVHCTIHQGVIPIVDMDSKEPYWGKGCQLIDADSVSGVIIKSNITILNIERYY
jgi:hypothetical protein